MFSGLASLKLRAQFRWLVLCAATLLWSSSAAHAQIYQWGYLEGYGQISSVPTLAPGGLTNVVQMATGTEPCVVLKADGTVWTWGANNYGSFGDGTTDATRTTPGLVSSLKNIVQIAVGTAQCYALRSDGTVWAWGLNEESEIGDGTTTNRYLPVQVPGLSKIVQVAAGGGAGIALKSDGTVWYWGTGLAWLSNPAQNYLTPHQLPLPFAAMQVAAGDGFALILKTDGTLWAIGEYGSGQLGNSGNYPDGTLVQTQGLTNVVQIDARYDNSLALTSDGTVWVWGYNGYGEIGDGTTQDRYTPFAAFTGAVQATLGNRCVHVLKADSTIWGWGTNGDGILGDGTTRNNRYSPVQTVDPTGTSFLTGQTLLASAIEDSMSAQAAVQKTLITPASLTVAYAAGLGAKLVNKSFGNSLLVKPVDFTIDGTDLGSVNTVASGVATVPLPIAFGPGSHTVTATFAGDWLFSGSSATFTLTVTKADTSVTAKKASILRGVPANLSATLTRKTDGGHPAGETLIFKIDGTAIGSAATDATGTATLSFTADTTLAVGSHALTAEFAGDSNHNASVSGNAVLTVSLSKTNISPSGVTAALGQTVSLKARLRRSSDGSVMSNEMVAFTVAGNQAGTAVTDSNGIATLSYTVPLNAALGAESITATFTGDSLYAACAGTATLTVNQPTTYLTPTNASGKVGQQVSLKALLRSKPGSLPVVGRAVTFQLGSTVLGTATTDSTGYATLACTIPAGTAPGAQAVGVSFAGDSTYLSSTATLTFTVR